jgi:hypothetical protein
MKIATFGSWIDNDSAWSSRGNRSEFEIACRQAGQAIGDLGHTIIVGSSRPHTADKHFVDGVLAGTRSATDSAVPNIIVIRPFDQVADFARLSAERQLSFRFIDRPGLRADGVKVLGVKEADVVLTIGGAGGTYVAGLAAVLAKKPLIPIGSFGGASRHLIDAVRELEGNADHLDELNSPWSPSLLQSVLKIAGLKPVKPVNVLLIHGRSDDWKDMRHWLSTTLRVDVTVMKDAFSDGRTLPEKFEELASHSDAAIAVATPDDVGGLAGGSANELDPRARENVWIEYGWFWGKLGRKRVLLLHKGQVGFPSDLAGLEFYSYNESPLERSEKIREFIQGLRPGQLLPAA